MATFLVILVNQRFILRIENLYGHTGRHDSDVIISPFCQNLYAIPLIVVEETKYRVSLNTATILVSLFRALFLLFEDMF